MITLEQAAVNRPTTRWTWIAYAYGALVVFGFGYFLYDIPIQVSDSYNNLVEASGGTLQSLVAGQFQARAFLRPLLWAHIRVVYDLSGGHYFEWFRGWHVGQVALLTVLFLRLVRPQRLADVAAVPVGLAALVGIHTFAGTVREAFPINAYMTIVLCCYLAADLALGAPRWWRDVAAALLFVFAVLSVESGLLVAVVFVAAFAAGARGVSARGQVAIVSLVAGYFVLRFLVLDVGTPALTERSSGFGFSYRDPDELVAMFGGSALPFYAYNVMSSLASVLLSEPRGGMFVATHGLVEGSPSLASLVNVCSSLLALIVMATYVWQRRADWWARRFTRADQLVIVFAAVALANSAISYAYTKDVILSPAGSFFAAALTVAIAHVLESSFHATTMRRVVTTALLCALSCGWTFRAIGSHIGLRGSAAVVRNEWAYVDFWLERQHIEPKEPAAMELKRHLEHDAIWNHPVRPFVLGDWLEWFADE